MHNPTQKPTDELTTAQAAKLLGKSAGWMAHLRCQKKGPKYHRRGRAIVYLRGDVEAYKDADNTSAQDVLVVEIKTLQVHATGDGKHTLRLNGEDHIVDPSAGAFLVARKPSKRGKA